MQNKMENRVVPEEIQRQLSRWNAIAVLLRITHVFLGLIGIIAPLLVASFADILSTLQTRILSFSTAASVAVFAGFEIGTLTTRFRDAWKLLNGARVEYETGVIDMKELTQAYREGEKLIGQLKPAPFDNRNANNTIKSEPR